MTSSDENTTEVDQIKNIMKKTKKILKKKDHFFGNENYKIIFISPY
jgi:hypothetical protein